MTFGAGCILALGIIALFGMAGFLATRGADMDAAEMAIVASSMIALSNGIVGITAYAVGKESGKKEKEK